MAELRDPEFYLHRLIQRLMHRQDLYQVREDYAVGNHPLPEGDPRYVKALQDIQRKAKTNYIGLAIKAVTDRMKFRGMKFLGEVDEDARRIWRANNMDLAAQIAIGKAAELSDVYAMVSPPLEEGGEPVITIEDPRTCIVEPDPLDPLKSIVGLKFYSDSISETIVAVLMFPEAIYTFEGPSPEDFLTREQTYSPANIVSSTGFKLVGFSDNPIGVVPLVRGAWQPKYGLRGMAECEDGGWDIQDRINWVVMSRLVLTKSQAFRQRWMTGVDVPRGKDGVVKQTPFEPGADLVWAVVSENAKFGDFEQADLKQALEAARDDIGDFAAITQTPVTYLTNKMVNVSGSTMTAAQASLISKTRTRLEAMGWFFEAVIKICFLYKGDSERANDAEAETLWADPEMRSMAEVADFISKTAASNLPPQLFLEKSGMFSPEETEFAAQEIERLREQQMQDQIELSKAAAANRPQGQNPNQKTAGQAKKPAANKTSSGRRPK